MPGIPLVLQDLPVFFDVGRVGSAVPKRAGGGALCAGQSSSTRGAPFRRRRAGQPDPRPLCEAHIYLSTAAQRTGCDGSGGAARGWRPPQRRRRGFGSSRQEGSVWVLLGGSSPPDPMGRRLLGGGKKRLCRGRRAGSALASGSRTIPRGPTARQKRDEVQKGT
jgi:hypothetical protein